MRKILFFAAFFAAAFVGNAQNLVKNGNFNEVIDVKTYQKVPDKEGWFIFDKTEGKTQVTSVIDDNKHGNVLQIETTSDNVWYKSFIAQRIKGAEKGSYVVSFDMKALTPKIQVRVFLRGTNNDKIFMLRDGFDIDDATTKKQSAAAYSRTLKKTGQWLKVTASFDLSKTVDNIYSVGNIEKKGGKISVKDASAEVIDDFILVIQLQSKNSKALIDNVSIKKK